MSLAAELEKLYEAGAVTLPAAANEYAGAGGGLHDTSANDHDGFGRRTPSGEDGNPRESMTPSMPGEDPVMMTDFSLGQMQEPFMAMRNMLQDQIIWQTHKNLISAGEALIQIAEAYAETDGEAATRLEEKKNQLEGSTPDIADPPPRSGDE